MTIQHLYIHVPFCTKICPYCDFHVMRRSNGLVEKYLEILEKEAKNLSQNYSHDIKTIYIGGGTPSMLGEFEIEFLANIIDKYFGFGDENTIEINPGTVTKERAKHWKNLGFNRASVGVQSLDNNTLRFLGRNHTAKMALKSIEKLKEENFNVSADLMTAIKNQPLEEDIKKLVSMDIDHISAYTLTIEPGTEFQKRGILVEEKEEQKGFELTEKILESFNFSRYEISNYAKNNKKSKHNLSYWQNKFYFGLGPSATGHYPSKKYFSERKTNHYLFDWLAEKEPDTDFNNEYSWITDALFMGLRLKEGVDINHLEKMTEIDIKKHYKKALEKNLALGLLILESNTLKSTKEGWWILNKIITDFLLIDE